MFGKEELNESLKRNGLKANAKHEKSRFYSKFFEGYEEYMDKESGKIIRIYTADYYRYPLSRDKRTQTKAIYTAILTLLTVLFIWTGRMPVIANAMLYVVIPQAASLLFAGLSWIGLIYYYPVKELLTIYQYKQSHDRLCSATLGLAISCSMTAFSALGTSLILCLRHSVSFYDWMPGIGAAICALLAISVFRYENRLDYDIVENHNAIPLESIGQVQE